MRFIVRAGAVEASDGRTEMPQRLGMEVSPGSKSRARLDRGSPGTWETRPSPERKDPVGEPGHQNPGLRVQHGGAAGAKQDVQPGTPAQGDERRGDGWSGVRATWYDLRSGGTRTCGDPAEERR
jgi:hypothetical protein